MSEIDVITDLLVWPDNGEAPLSVSLLVKVSTLDQVRRKWILKNGNEKLEANHSDPIQSTYNIPGTYDETLEIELIKQGSISGGKREFTITISPSMTHPLINTVYDSVKGIAYPDTHVKFTLAPHRIGAMNVAEMTWHFENGSINESWDKGSFDKNHTYSSPGKYTEQVTIKTKDGIIDSKSFYILILPKI